MVGMLVHGGNHFIVRGPLPDREVALTPRLRATRRSHDSGCLSQPTSRCHVPLFLR
jgi:hypothetical protein